MKLLAVLALTAAVSAVAAVADAQPVLNLSGQFRCVQGCAGGQLALIAQYGWDMRIVNEAGAPSRAWIDRPGHIWVQNWNEGAVYSPDGMVIQFDRGTIWQRDLGEGLPPGPPPSAAVPPRGQRPARTATAPAAPVERAPAAQRTPAAVNDFDGSWSVVILTQSGGCDPSYRYGLRISNGAIVNDVGESVNLQGRVWPNGTVRVNVSSGGQSASGQGHMSRMSGSGTWYGQGSAGSCSGVWQATRRG